MQLSITLALATATLKHAAKMGPFSMRLVMLLGPESTGCSEVAMYARRIDCLPKCTYEQDAQPFEWRFTKADLHKLLAKNESKEYQSLPRAG